MFKFFHPSKKDDTSASKVLGELKKVFYRLLFNFFYNQLFVYIRTRGFYAFTKIILNLKKMYMFI